jgi:hypothetical protein
MENRSPGTTGRPRGSDAAVPELQGADTLTLARWVAGATSGGISQRSAARLAGISVRHAQRLMDRHAGDGFVARDRLIGQALRWEQQGAEALAEATSRATNWLREASGNPEADPREVAAALGATVQAGHRLTEAGARRAKRLQPVEQPQGTRFDLEGFLSQIAAACNEVKALPESEQPAAYEALRQRLKADQEQALDVVVVETLETIDVESMPSEQELHDAAN